jgi:hypothetical protein
MNIIGIDPGPTQSAFVEYDGVQIREFGKVPNAKLCTRLACHVARTGDVLAIEMIASYGMPVGAEVFETCVWIGRFIEAWGLEFEQVYRNRVKNHLCHSSKANDSNIRQALIDMFGGKEKAIGRKATPGPLHEIKGDVWSALAVAVTYADQQAAKEKP